MIAGHPDAALLAAFDVWRGLSARLYGLGVTDDEYETILNGLDDTDPILLGDPGKSPSTLEGVVAKLWRMLPSIEQERWLARAVAYGDVETIRERLDELPFPYDHLTACILTLGELCADNRALARSGLSDLARAEVAADVR